MREVRPRRDDRGTKPRSTLQQLDEAARHQPGADDEDHRERHLGDDERVRVVRRSRRAAARAFAQRLLQLGRRRANRRHEAEDDAGDHRDAPP